MLKRGYSVLLVTIIIILLLTPSSFTIAEKISFDSFPDTSCKPCSESRYSTEDFDTTIEEEPQTWIKQYTSSIKSDTKIAELPFFPNP